MLVLFFGPPPVSRRVLHAAGYAALTLVSVLPVFALLVTLKSSASTFNYAAVESADLSAVASSSAARAAAWISTGSRMFSIPGLLLGLTGLVLLARRRAFALPLLVVLAHWFSWTVIPGFTWNGSPVWLRTYPYVLPFFCLGAGYVAAATTFGELEVARWKMPSWTVRSLVLGLVLAHLTVQTRTFLAGGDGASRVPETWTVYRQGQGTLRPIVKAVDSLTPLRSTLLIWSYPLQDAYVSLSERRPEAVLPALENLWARYKEGTLEDYLNRRRFSVPCGDPLFLLADRAVASQQIERAISDVFSAAKAACGTRGIDAVSSWPTQADVYGDVILYSFK
jgi:hypothetical protein